MNALLRAKPLSAVRKDDLCSAFGITPHALTMTFPREPFFFVAPVCLLLPRPLFPLSRLSCSLPSCTAASVTPGHPTSSPFFPFPSVLVTKRLSISFFALRFCSSSHTDATAPVLTLALQSYYASSPRISNDPNSISLALLGRWQRPRQRPRRPTL